MHSFLFRFFRTAAVATLGLFFLSGSASGVEKTFDGLYLGLDLGILGDLSNTEGNYSYINLHGGGPYVSETGKKKSSDDFDLSPSGALKLGYGFAIEKDYYFGLESAVHFEDSYSISSGTYTFSNPASRPDYIKDMNVVADIDPDIHVSLAFQPGIKIYENLLVYGSCAYHFMRADIFTQTDFDRSTINAAATLNENRDKENFHGVSLGVGLKYAFTENWMMNFKAEWVYFGDKDLTGPDIVSAPDEITFRQTTSIQPSWTTFHIGVEYHF